MRGEAEELSLAFDAAWAGVCFLPALTAVRFSPCGSARFTRCVSARACAGRKPSVDLSPHPSRLTPHQYRLDLDPCAARQLADADCGTRRIRLLEILRHNVIEPGKMRQVRQEHRDFHCIVETRACGASGVLTARLVTAWSGYRMLRHNKGRPAGQPCFLTMIAEPPVAETLSRRRLVTTPRRIASFIQPDERQAGRLHSRAHTPRPAQHDGPGALRNKE